MAEELKADYWESRSEAGHIGHEEQHSRLAHFKHRTRIQRLVALGLLLALLVVHAEPVLPADALRAAANWLQENQFSPLETSMNRLDDNRIEAVHGKSGEALLFHVPLQPDGFILLAADSNCHPVVCFSEQGTFESDDPSSPLRQICMSQVRKLLDDADTLRSSQTRGTDVETEKLVRSANETWQSLLSGQVRGVSSVSDVRVSPLVKSQWNQSTVNNKNVYNYYTPNNMVCGCVATAGAQIMRYHRHPQHSVPKVTNVCDVDGTLMRLTSWGGVYDWNNMPLVPASQNLTNTQCQAIGRLTSDLGIASFMHYTPSGSGSYNELLAEALRNVFDYASAVSVTGQAAASNFSNAVLCNFDAGYPVMLGISGSEGGHAVVADGYGYLNSKLYVHINLGWGGNCDAWFNIPTVDAGSYRYDTLDDIIYNIIPDMEAELITGRVFDRFGTPCANASVSAHLPGDNRNIAIDFTDEKGIYALMVPRPYSRGETVGYLISARKDEWVGSTSTTVRASINYTYNFNPETRRFTYYSDGQVGNGWGNNITLSRNTVSVKFHPEGGTVSPSTVTFGIGQPFGSKLPVPSRDGYNFNYWYYMLGNLEIPVLWGTLVQETISDLYASWSMIDQDFFMSWYFTFELNATRTGYVITDYYASNDEMFAEELRLPQRYNDLPVVGIAKEALKRVKTKKLIIPDSIKEIANDILFINRDLEELVVGAGISVIPTGGFSGLKNLRKIVLSDSLTTIGVNAFTNCDSLREIEIPGSVTTIGDYAFSYCGSLESITIPAGVQQLGKELFTGCINLTSINVEPGNPLFASNDGVLLSKDKKTLLAFPPGRDGVYFVPSSVETIGDSAFEDSALSEIVLPYSLREIGHYAFRYSGQLTRINLPVYLQQVYGDSFSSCSLLQEVVVEEGNEWYYADDGALFSKDGQTLLLCFKRDSSCYRVPDGVRVISSYAFITNSTLTEIDIPEGVTTIYSYCFEACKRIKAITLPSTLSFLGYWSFPTGYYDDLESISFLGGPPARIEGVYYYSSDPLGLKKYSNPLRINVFRGLGWEESEWASYYDLTYCDEIGNNRYVSIAQGWNPLGMTCTPNADAQATLKAIGTVFVWNEGRFAPLEGDLKAGMGCWLFSDEDTRVLLLGREEIPEPPAPGWNWALPGSFPNSPAIGYRYDHDRRCYLRVVPPFSSQEPLWLYY